MVMSTSMRHLNTSMPIRMTTGTIFTATTTCQPGNIAMCIDTSRYAMRMRMCPTPTICTPIEGRPSLLRPATRGQCHNAPCF